MGGKSDNPPPQDGWASKSEYGASSAFEDDRLPERQITLTLRIPPLSLPGEETSPSSFPDAEQRASEKPAHLDAWNVDRVQRSSFPPSAPGTAPPAARLIPTTPVPRELVDAVMEEEEGDALALAGRYSPPSPALDLVSEMAERFALGDFSGCLRVSELLLGQDPDHLLAAHYARESHEKLESLLISRLTAHGRTPELLVPESEIRWLGLDSRVGLVVSHIDGAADVDAVAAASGMPRLEVLRCLTELVEAKVVRLV